MVQWVEHNTAYEEYCEARAEEQNEARQIEKHFEELNKKTEEKSDTSE